ncbi:hypothetical protein VTH06DRAFT_45 [Thermothelomyces fergusii]
MRDAVRLSEEQLRDIYADGYTSWLKCYTAAIQSPALPVSYLLGHNAFARQPSFPATPLRDHGTYASNNRKYMTGCAFVIGTRYFVPVRLTTAKGDDGIPNWESWFPGTGRNYLSLLTLAWAFILSARWSEIMGIISSVRYLASRAPLEEDERVDDDDGGDERQNAKGGQQEGRSSRSVHNGGPPRVIVDIGNATSHECRWWAAILAPGRGWEAVVPGKSETFWSPWSIRVLSGPRFVIRRRAVGPEPSACEPPSFAKALEFLDKFCRQYNVVEQSHAALAAALLLPSISESMGTLCLPPLVASGRPAIREKGRRTSRLRHDWLRIPEHHLDRLLTASCNIRGTEPALLNAFFNPDIECNAVTPWLQGALTAIDSFAVGRPLVLGRMMMARAPKAAFLWVGATVLGVGETLLTRIRLGSLPTDLNTAAWSGTLQHFLQQPVEAGVSEDGKMTRADYCRLLALTVNLPSPVFPMSPWKPFGLIPLWLAGPLVQLHAACNEHQLQYLSFLWHKTPAFGYTIPAVSGITPSRSGTDDSIPRPRPISVRDWKQVVADESASKEATQDVFEYMATVNPESERDAERSAFSTTISAAAASPPLSEETAAQEPPQPRWRPPSDGALEQRPVLVVGAGNIGRRVALVWASNRRPVTIYDISAEALRSAAEYVTDNLGAYCAARETQPGPVRTTTDLRTATATSGEPARDRAGAVTAEELTRAPWLAVECLPESRPLKTSVLALLERSLPADCVLASNSSSLTTAEMAAEGPLRHPHRLLNTHYLIPPRNRMVELMSSGATDPAIFPFLAAQMRRVGLAPVAVPDGLQSPGLVFERVWAACKREALAVLAEGVARPADVDALFRDFFHAEKGPCERMDEVGLDAVAAAERHNLDRDPALASAPALRWLREHYLDRGRLGEKTGDGLFTEAERARLREGC